MFASYQKDSTPAMKAHLSQLLQATFGLRRKVIIHPGNMDTSQLVDKVWKDFPCLQSEAFVSIKVLFRNTRIFLHGIPTNILLIQVLKYLIYVLVLFSFHLEFTKVFIKSPSL